MKRNRICIDAARDELAKHGAEIVGEEWDHKHPRVKFRWKGETWFYVCSGTPSDAYGAIWNVRRDVRHVLGIAGHRRRRKSSAMNAGRRGIHRGRDDPAPSPAPKQITPGPPGLTALEETPAGDATRSERYRMAWQRYWDGLKHEMGITIP